MAPIEITEITETEIDEIDERKATSPARASPLISAALGGGTGIFLALDERGESLTSPQFTDAIAAERDQSRPSLGFVIGGADGLETLFRARASRRISFGPMVWPHFLARVMVLE